MGKRNPAGFPEPRRWAPRTALPFVPHMKALGRSDRTVTMYADAIRWFAAEHL
ncbi:hypothetical protein ACFO4E_12775 [Nocardiopsis mangrovi]|uniref:Integrase n=1 Tax=Nocardiopsis mangrovi TaxID=1179818 RepID=A0ABV9DVI5_9ACTN